MTCEHCHGEVNVSMHNGATLRCGCGKSMERAPMPMRLEIQRAMPTANTWELHELLKLMRENKALRVRSGELEVELHPDAFAPAWSAQNSSLDATEKPCRCGHSIPVQHNPEGQCLEGCEPDACAEKAAA